MPKSRFTGTGWCCRISVSSICRQRNTPIMIGPVLLQAGVAAWAPTPLPQSVTKVLTYVYSTMRAPARLRWMGLLSIEEPQNTALVTCIVFFSRAVWAPIGTAGCMNDSGSRRWSPLCAAATALHFSGFPALLPRYQPMLAARERYQYRSKTVQIQSCTYCARADAGAVAH